MNIAKLALRQWLRMYEAAHYLTSKLTSGPYGSDNGISERDVLDFALEGCFLLTLDIPPRTTDKRFVELEDGYWDLLIKGPRGKPGRRQIDETVNRVKPDRWKGVLAKEMVIKKALFESGNDADAGERLFAIIKAQSEY